MTSDAAREQGTETDGVIYNPPKPHACRLSASGRWAPKELRPGAVEVCPDCGQAWVYDPIPRERTYRKVRPWPFDRAQRAALRQYRNPTGAAADG